MSTPAGGVSGSGFSNGGAPAPVESGGETDGERSGVMSGVGAAGGGGAPGRSPAGGPAAAAVSPAGGSAAALLAEAPRAFFDGVFEIFVGLSAGVSGVSGDEVTAGVSCSGGNVVTLTSLGSIAGGVAGSNGGGSVGFLT